MANKGTDQPDAEQGGRDREINENRDEGIAGSGADEIRGIADEDEDDEDFDETEDLEVEEDTEGEV
jgi:hypothetical protein